MNNNDLNNNIEECKEKLVEVDNGVNEDKKTSSKRCKLIIFIFIVLSLALGSMLIINNKNTIEGIEGAVVSLSDLEPISKEVVNLKNYIKEGLNFNEDIGEYGGGSMLLEDGKYLNYSYYPNEGFVLIEIYNEDNSLIFETKIKNDNNDIDVNRAIITKDNEILIAINSFEKDSDKLSYAKILKFNLDGKMLSELNLEDRIYTVETDDFDNIVVAHCGENFKNYKLIKFNSENKKIFEYNLQKEDILLRLFTEGDKTMIFTSDFSRFNFNAPVKYFALNKKGEEIFKKENIGLSREEMGSIIKTTEGNFLIEEIGYEQSSQAYGRKIKSIIKVDNEINQLWKKEINKMVDWSQIMELNNEYILFTNEIYYVKEENTKSVVTSLTKLDSSGNQVWCKYLDYDKNEKYNILNKSEVHLDKGLYNIDENLIIKATVFEDYGNEGSINLTIDSDGNIL